METQNVTVPRTPQRRVGYGRHIPTSAAKSAGYRPERRVVVDTKLWERHEAAMAGMKKPNALEKLWEVHAEALQLPKNLPKLPISMRKPRKLIVKKTVDKKRSVAKQRFQRLMERSKSFRAFRKQQKIRMRAERRSSTKQLSTKHLEHEPTQGQKQKEALMFWVPI